MKPLVVGIAIALAANAGAGGQANPAASPSVQAVVTARNKRRAAPIEARGRIGAPAPRGYPSVTPKLTL